MNGRDQKPLPSGRGVVTKRDATLDEAKRLITGDRNAQYGEPYDNFSRTARMWSEILGVDVTPTQVGLCMIAVKLSRAIETPGGDTLVDIAGYAALTSEVHDMSEKVQAIAAFTEEALQP